jgi:beta-1,2-mannobiose phosphorylase / 1,2-beta-oligomannan phosphorylase
MIEIKREGIILQKSDQEFENEGVLNPAAIRVGDEVHMFYRAVQKGNHSTIGYCKFDGPLTIVEQWKKPFMVPEFEYETQGVEDARITKIDEVYYMTYTGYDGTNARGVLATSKDLKTFKKHGMIVPPITYAEFVTITEHEGKVNENYYHNHSFYFQESDPDKKIMLWDKNVVFFPRRINGNLVFLHRIRPGIQIVSVKSLADLTKKFWDKYFDKFHSHVIMDPVYKHESNYIGSGCPPIETEEGWLLIYHGVEKTVNGNEYSACAALLDLKNPEIELCRLPYALLSPKEIWEKNGEVSNVVFPTGAVVFGDTLFIYYGAADERIACASLQLSKLIEELVQIKNM